MEIVSRIKNGIKHDYPYACKLYCNYLSLDFIFVGQVEREKKNEMPKLIAFPENTNLFNTLTYYHKPSTKHLAHCRHQTSEATKKKKRFFLCFLISIHQHKNHNMEHICAWLWFCVKTCSKCLSLNILFNSQLFKGKKNKTCNYFFRILAIYNADAISVHCIPSKMSRTIEKYAIWVRYMQQHPMINIQHEFHINFFALKTKNEIWHFILSGQMWKHQKLPFSR